LRNLKELTIQSNDKLVRIDGCLGRHSSLVFLDLFGCPNLVKVDLCENNCISKLRIGSWTDQNPILNEFSKLSRLNEIIIDNYRTSEIDLEFIKSKDISIIKVYCPSVENIKTLSLQSELETLRISRQVNCTLKDLSYIELLSLEKLKHLELNLGGKLTRMEFEEFIGRFKNLSYVELFDTYWTEHGAFVVNGVDVYINN